MILGHSKKLQEQILPFDARLSSIPCKVYSPTCSKSNQRNSQAGGLLCDPFMGSGTTLVEAIVNGRRAYGTDINPVAVLIAKTKTTPIEPTMLKQEVNAIFSYLQAALEKEKGQSFLVDRSSEEKDILVRLVWKKGSGRYKSRFPIRFGTMLALKYLVARGLLRKHGVNDSDYELKCEG